MTKENIKEEELTKNNIEDEESLDLEELESVFSEDEDESIDSSDEEESPFQQLLKKGKNEGFITYAELNEKADLVFALEINEWNGHTNEQLNVKDIRSSE